MKNQPLHIGMNPSHPATFLKQEIIEPYGLSVEQTAEVLGVTNEVLSNVIVNGSPISPELALRIEKAFNVSMDMLLKMQAWHDSYMMRQKENDIHVKQYQPV
jgi:addiction module HigA family antidote